jgi:hypothetical protein
MGTMFGCAQASRSGRHGGWAARAARANKTGGDVSRALALGLLLGGAWEKYRTYTKNSPARHATVLCAPRHSLQTRQIAPAKLALSTACILLGPQTPSDCLVKAARRPLAKFPIGARQPLRCTSSSTPPIETDTVKLADLLSTLYPTA